MEYEKAIPFKNWTLKDFKGQFASTYYEFRAGATYSVPQSQAQHFAKQLAVRELHEHGYQGSNPGTANPQVRGEMLSDIDMKEYMDKCFPSVKPGDPETSTGSFDRIDETSDTEAKEAVGVKDANTTTPREIPDGEEDAADEKNNAGTPKFKGKAGRPAKVKPSDKDYE